MMMLTTIFLLNLITAGNLVIAGLLLFAAYSTCRQPLAMVKLILLGLRNAVVAALIVFAILHFVKTPNWPIGEIAFMILLLGMIPFSFGYGIGSEATHDVGRWQQLACVLCVPLFVVSFPIMASRGGHGGAFILALIILPGLLALIPGWLLGSLLNTKTLPRAGDART